MDWLCHSNGSLSITESWLDTRSTWPWPPLCICCFHRGVLQTSPFLGGPSLTWNSPQLSTLQFWTLTFIDNTTSPVLQISWNSVCRERRVLIRPKWRMTSLPEVEEENFKPGVFWVYNSDSSGEIRVVKVNVLCSSLRAFYSARLLNSYCSTGAAQLPTVDSCGCTWQLACVNVCNLKAFFLKKHACLVNIP